MKISLKKDDLIKGIQVVQNAVSTRGSLPILANILLEAENGKVNLTATDLDIAVSCELPAEVAVGGNITIPAKRFGDVIKELNPQHDIQLELIKGNTIKIQSQKTYFRIPGLPKDDFPQIPMFTKDKKTVGIAQKTLHHMIRMTQFAMSRDEVRYVLNGTLFVFDKNKLRLVAADGRRLAMMEKNVGKDFPFNQSVIVPTKTIHELSRNLGEEGEVEIMFKDNQLQFKIDSIRITSRLIEGEFPNYEQVIPKKTKEEFQISTRDFLSAAKRASIFTNQDSQSIKISLNSNRMVITKNTPDLGEAYEEIETNYSGDDFTIGFNPSYLIDVLKNIAEDTITFGVIDPEKPGVIKANEDYTYIVLPMQLNS